MKRSLSDSFFDKPMWNPTGKLFSWRNVCFELFVFGDDCNVVNYIINLVVHGRNFRIRNFYFGKVTNLVLSIECN